MTRAELRREIAEARRERSASRPGGSAPDTGRWVAATVRLRIAEARLASLPVEPHMRERVVRARRPGRPVPSVAPPSSAAPASWPYARSAAPIRASRWRSVVRWAGRHPLFVVAAVAVLAFLTVPAVREAVETFAGLTLIVVGLAVALWGGRLGRRPHRRSRG